MHKSSALSIQTLKRRELSATLGAICAYDVAPRDIPDNFQACLYTTSGVGCRPAELERRVQW